MKNYEVTFIVDPVLSGEEIKSTAQTYVKHLESEGCKIVHNDEMGLRQLAYPINKRTSGIYYSVEFSSPTGDVISKVELALRRDERIMRFLTIKLDKYGVKYNDDKRNGLIGKNRDEDQEEEKEKEQPAKTAPRKTEKPKAVAPKPEAKPEPKAKAKAEAKAEPKVEAKAEPKAEAKPEPKAEAKATPEAKSEEE
jgi:small subunit ribosomal protein S6